MATSSDFSRSCFIGSDEVKVILCEPCEQAGNQIEAEGFCVNCSEYLCGLCFKKHKLFKAFRSHVLQDKDSMPQSLTEARIKDVCVTNCDLHTDKVIEYYCLSCDVLGCTTCITLDHRQCEKVEHIPNIVKSTDVYGDLQIDLFVNKVDLFSQHVRESKRELQSQTDAADVMRKEAKATLKKERAEIKNFFDKLEREMEDKIDKIHTSNMTILTAATKTYDTIDTQLSNIKTEISKKQKGRQKCETFISIKKSTSFIDSAEKETKAMQKESKILQYKFLPLLQIKAFMEQINEIGNLETKNVALPIPVAKLQLPIGKPSLKKHLPEKQTTDLSKESTLINISSNPYPVLRLMDEINVKTSSDDIIPIVTGVAMVQEHFVVVADKINKAVKVIDVRSKEVTSKLKIDDRVWTVTKVSEDTVAIGMDLSIQLLSVSKHGLLSKSKVLDTNIACIGAVHSKEMLILANVSSIRIIDIQGNELKEIKTDSEKQQLFNRCYDVEISKTHETIYASDSDKNTVTCMTLDGNVKAIYTDSDLQQPWGITVDNEGYVYVCSVGTDSIHQLSEDCTKLQVFKDIPGLCITCTNKNKLIVGDLDIVKIYDLN